MAWLQEETKKRYKSTLSFSLEKPPQHKTKTKHKMTATPIHRTVVGNDRTSSKAQAYIQHHSIAFHHLSDGAKSQPR